MPKPAQLLLHFAMLSVSAAIVWTGYGFTRHTLLLILAVLLTMAAIVPASRWLAVKALCSPSKSIRFLETIRAHIANETPSFEKSAQHQEPA